MPCTHNVSMLVQCPECDAVASTRTSKLEKALAESNMLLRAVSEMLREQTLENYAEAERRTRGVLEEQCIVQRIRNIALLKGTE